MKTIVVAATKGGTGKSTVTAALAVQASKMSGNVALLDLNEDQGNLSHWWRLRGEPDNPHLLPLPKTLVKGNKVLEREGWSHLFIDTPSIGIDLIEAAIVISDFVVIPVRASVLDLVAARDVLEIVSARNKAHAFLLNAVDVSHGHLAAQAEAALVAGSPVLEAKLSYAKPYIDAMMSGRTAAEDGEAWAGEIGALWAEITMKLGH